MIKKLFAATLLLLVLQTQNALAHEGGHEKAAISPNSALTIAQDVVEQFSSFDPGLGFGQLKSSWKGLPNDSFKIEVGGQGYYVVSVTNRGEQKPLYLLISAEGDIYDANFTGEFPKVD